MKETLTGIVQAIVDHPDQVTVTEEISGSNIDLTLNVAPEDMGMVIGRHGRIAKAIRTVIKAAASGSGKKVNVEIR
ncbi:MAG: KH domain-containing protein [Ruminococcaceae bacterium]|nr:KH domain-containing protein [Oscillospiraceae bacterium]MBQ7398239.1 KH domain-containing protein [Clostridia bacterium]MBR2621464.1 KH domain-containing protein [Clostridia bacterium]